ncbi:Nucleoside-diphosphate-sugar epimerase [Raineyella antarctica]|uniref:Nucleoside-diphosphate-sugar epimerase n=1 Tax=Raineyella antarctica TaxID=1577474 RepID=A0A1G6GFA1_9ACTN|nr:NAD-dependent epimerase/dehydratase family protein [Raineyella antarctica]SDB80513.1 Nucleoside-diphosphate-sugar epimerase [Raineyella antarctica]
MAFHLVVGAGPIGRHVAAELASEGEEVVLASRSGTGPALPGIRRLALDATDAAATAEAARGAAALYNCVNPPHYHRWPQEWPPIAAALLQAAERSGAVLATTSNLYPYGRPTAPMVEGQPDTPAEAKGEVRARMWADALTAHRAGRARVVEVRSSDYVGDIAGMNASVPRALPAALAGRTARVIGDPDQPHTWTDVDDVARLLVAAAADPTAWGRVWHTPSNPPRTQRQALADACAAVGKEPGDVRAYPDRTLALASTVVPALRAIRAMSFQFTAPFVMASATTQQHFGLAPTPWPQVCERTARAALSRAA